MTQPSGDWVEISTVGEEVARAFVPHALPPHGLAIAPKLRTQLDRALLALGRLDSIATLLPDKALFLYAYVRKEAVLSSQIEGTQSTLSDLLLFELEEVPGVPLDDVAEVSRYVAALEHGIRRLNEGFPICARLVRELHRVLLASGRGAEKDPGEFRRSQNWIGGTRPGNATYVPPPWERVDECMAALEAFIHDDSSPVLVKAALAHAQFETIHPFLDGNGRVGRLLITLILREEGALRDPLLYLSLFFKRHKTLYYELLQRTRTHGEWQPWLDFFAEGVEETANGAVETARNLSELFETDRLRIQAEGRAAGSALRVHQALQSTPVASIPFLVEECDLSFPTVSAALDLLERLGIVAEPTGKRRNRRFTYVKYLAILAEGTERP